MFGLDFLTGRFRRLRSFVLRRDVRVVGRCNRCGDCCRSVLLRHQGRWLRGLARFERLVAEAPEHGRFRPVGRNVDGFLLFDCDRLDGLDLCSCHGTRPALCRNYPSKSLYYQGGRLPDGCGYAFKAVTFRDVLFGRKPFKPADFSAVLGREIQQEKRQADMKKLIFILIAALLTGGGVWYFTAGQSKDRIKVLKTAEVTRGSVSKVLEATGIVKAQVGACVKIGAQATGVLESVPVKVGDHVKKGQLVARIDARELKARIAEAKANLDLAEAKLHYMEKNLPRKRTLVQKRLEAQDSLDVATQDTEMARYSVAAAKAFLDTLKVQLSYTSIYSPIDGVVSRVAAQEGETIVSGPSVSNLITVLNPEKLEMWIYVDETDVGRVKPGLPVRYTVDAYRDKVFEGSVDRIYPEPEIRDNIVYYRTPVKVTREQADFLRPEMTTQCKIVVRTKDDVLTVPNNALKWVKDRQVCFRVTDPEKQPEEVSPKLGLVGLERSEVLEGLSEGDVVATQLVLPGAKVGKKGL